MNGHKIPTADAVAVLPRLAQIAYAARCCRRVQPIYGIRLRVSDTESLNLAIEAAEQTAATGQPAPGDAGRVPFEVASWNYDNRVGYAAEAVSAVVAFAIELNSANALTTATCAYAAGKYAFEAVALCCTPAWVEAVAAEMHRDYDTLFERACQEGWADSTTVSPGVFGLLWPHGPPPYWYEKGPPVGGPT